MRKWLWSGWKWWWGVKEMHSSFSSSKTKNTLIIDCALTLMFQISPKNYSAKWRIYCPKKLYQNDQLRKKVVLFTLRTILIVFWWHNLLYFCSKINLNVYFLQNLFDLVNMVRETLSLKNAYLSQSCQKILNFFTRSKVTISSVCKHHSTKSNQPSL